MRKIVFDIETTSAGIGIEPREMELAVIAIHDSETNKYQSFTQKELGDLWPIIERSDMLIGYNSNSFDIPILNKYYSGNLERIKSLDLLEEIREVLGRRIKLDKVAQGTLGEKKSGHGLDAVKWWKEGKVEKVKKYCIQDVKITKGVYDHAIKKGYLQYRTGNETLKIQLDTSDWEKPEGNSMTHTMPF